MKKSYILIIIFIVFILLISVIGSIVVSGHTKIKESSDIFTIQSNKEMYFSGYGYSMDNPNVIVNPYGNSPLTAIVMFETEDYSLVEIIVEGKTDDTDIKYTFSKNKHHLIPVYGLYSDYENTVIIKSEGKEKKLKIKTESLPDDFSFIEDDFLGNFKFYNDNYPYAIDSNNEVRWYLNGHYYGNITLIDNSNIIIGSDRYNENNNTISFYKMNLLGKIYDEYLLEESYYGFNTIYEDNVLVLSDKLLLIDFQTGEVIEEYIKNDGYNYLGVYDDNIIVRKDDTYYKIEDNGLEEISYSEENKNYSFYDDTENYNIVPSIRYGKLGETSTSSKRISLFKTDKGDIGNVTMEMDNDRIKVVNDNEDDIYIIFDKLLDRRVYEVGYIKYINLEGFSGNYTVYFKINDKVYKSDYYIEV